jgi:hypothetical protein
VQVAYAESGCGERRNVSARAVASLFPHTGIVSPPSWRSIPRILGSTSSGDET